MEYRRKDLSTEVISPPIQGLSEVNSSIPILSGVILLAFPPVASFWHQPV
jgi:hypothetical protein